MILASIDLGGFPIVITGLVMADSGSLLTVVATEAPKGGTGGSTQNRDLVHRYEHFCDRKGQALRHKMSYWILKIGVEALDGSTAYNKRDRSEHLEYQRRLNLVTLGFLAKCVQRMVLDKQSKRIRDILDDGRTNARQQEHFADLQAELSPQLSDKLRRRRPSNAKALVRLNASRHRMRGAHGQFLCRLNFALENWLCWWIRTYPRTHLVLDRFLGKVVSAKRVMGRRAAIRGRPQLRDIYAKSLERAASLEMQRSPTHPLNRPGSPPFDESQLLGGSSSSSASSSSSSSSSSSVALAAAAGRSALDGNAAGSGGFSRRRGLARLRAHQRRHGEEAVVFPLSRPSMVGLLPPPPADAGDAGEAQTEEKEATDEQEGRAASPAGGGPGAGAGSDPGSTSKPGSPHSSGNEGGGDGGGEGGGEDDEDGPPPDPEEMRPNYNI